MADNKIINVRIQQKYDSEKNWSTKNPVLLKGEQAFSSDKNNRYKVGDGVSTWSQLTYAKADLFKEDVTTALGYTPPTSNTWRGIQNNLTSDSTSDSLSAAQGKVLKGLVDGKASSGHSHDSVYSKLGHTHSYLPLSGGKVTGDIGIPFTISTIDGSVPYAGSGVSQKNVTEFSAYKTYLGSFTNTSGTWYNIISVRHRNGNNDGSSYGMAIYSTLTSGGNLLWNKQTGKDTWQEERTILDSSNYSSYAATKSHSHSAYYDSTISRTANTVLAAPNGTNGGATFRKLVAADLPLHTHNSVADIDNSNTTTFAYSKSGLGYEDFTWLAAWNGYELRAVAKSQFATADHSHNLNTMINGLSIGTATPVDEDYYVCQYAGGGTTTTTYHRRLHSALWSYVKGKTDSIYSVKSHTHNSITDINDSKVTTFAYSKSGLGYEDFTWLAAWNGYELRAINKSAFATAGHTHNYAGSSSAGGSANSAKELDCVQCTGNSNVIGWRLIATKSIAIQWCNYRSVFSIRSRHQGAGILCVSCGNNSDTISQNNAYAEIKYFGLTDSGNVVTSDSFYFYVSADGKTAYLFMKGYDYSDLFINKLNGEIDISNGAWMTSIASTYGSLKASTQINVATSATTAISLTSSAGSATQPVYFSGGKPVACSYTLSKSVPSDAKFTDTNTWRGIQNNLTSDSTSDSLSAAQGKVLKGLVDGKAASGHTHDLSTMINGLSIGTATPVDEDYYVCQYAGGGTTTTTYHRRSHSELYNYMKGKMDSVYAASSHTHTYLPLSGGTISGTVNTNGLCPNATKVHDIGSSSKRYNYLYVDQINACGSIGVFNDSSLSGEAIKMYSVSNNGTMYGSLRFSQKTSSSTSTITLLPNTSGTASVYIQLPHTAGIVQVSTSDARMKNNIKDAEVSDALSLINSIKLHSFDWRQNKKHQSIGFIADELEKLDNNLAVGNNNNELDENGLPLFPKCVNTFYLQGYEVKAIQELSQKNQQLENIIALLQKKLTELENKI